MAYFLTHCDYTENYKNGEHTYTFTGKCIVTGETISVTVKGSDLYRYHQGTLIQNAFPYLSASEREFMISGMSGKAFKDLAKE